jgi:peptidoglycan/LPS O-acetylase OafA/YrhL
VTTRRIPELDGLRGVAVSLVVLSHIQGLLPDGHFPLLLAPLNLLASGPLGVLIFFVLSGYLITSLMLGEEARTGRIAVGAFYARRAARIFPVSYLYITMVALLAVAGSAQVSATQVAVAALQVQNYSAVLFGPTGAGPFEGQQTLGHFWSLALEEQFYWLWPLVMVRWRRHAPVLLIGLVLAMPAVRAATYLLWPDARRSLLSMFHTALDPLAIGCLLAFAREQVSRRVARIDGVWITLAAVFLFAVTPLLSHSLKGVWSFTIGRTIESALAALLIVVLIDRPDFWLSRVLRWRPIHFLGLISFSLYVWQQPFCLTGAALVLPPWLAIPVSVSVAWLSYRFVEQPCQRWFRRRGLKVGAPAPA